MGKENEIVPRLGKRLVEAVSAFFRSQQQKAI